MPYNYKGDLYKREIVKKLQDMGLDVKSVNALNKINGKNGIAYSLRRLNFMKMVESCSAGHGQRKRQKRNRLLLKLR